MQNNGTCNIESARLRIVKKTISYSISQLRTPSIFTETNQWSSATGSKTPCLTFLAFLLPPNNIDVIELHNLAVYHLHSKMPVDNN